MVAFMHQKRKPGYWKERTNKEGLIYECKFITYNFIDNLINKAF
jgi:hypothetical protein